MILTGTTQSGSEWELTYEPDGGRHCLHMKVDGAAFSDDCGFDIPTTTEIGFGGGLKRGRGDFLLYGITSDRIASVMAASSAGDTTVETQELKHSSNDSGLRLFVLSRPPMENVEALVGLDSQSNIVQRIEFPKPPAK